MEINSFYSMKDGELVAFSGEVYDNGKTVCDTNDPDEFIKVLAGLFEKDEDVEKKLCGDCCTCEAKEEPEDEEDEDESGDEIEDEDDWMIEDLDDLDDDLIGHVMEVRVRPLDIMMAVAAGFGIATFLRGLFGGRR